MLNYKSIEDMKKGLEPFEYEKQNLLIIEKELPILWKVLKERDLFLKFDELTSHNAYCMLQNSYILVGDAVSLTQLFEIHMRDKSIFESMNIPDSAVKLIVCMTYNLFLEKIADFFKIILDIPKLCGRKSNFYGSPEILDKLSELIPDSQLFRYVEKNIRNSLAHYDFNIHEDKFIYNTLNKYEFKANHKHLSFDLLIQGNINLNRLVVILFKKIEDDLKVHFNEKRFKKDIENYDEESEKIIKTQKGKDCLKDNIKKQN